MKAAWYDSWRRVRWRRRNEWTHLEPIGLDRYARRLLANRDEDNLEPVWRETGHVNGPKGPLP